ncbi:MAG: type II toxin-antitoxin system PemK/MazF family toxin [Eubacteriales bacterium]
MPAEKKVTPKSKEVQPRQRGKAPIKSEQRNEKTPQKTQQQKEKVPLIQRGEKAQQVQRGEIVWCDLGEAVGSEQGGCRPVVIVQNDVGNTYSTTTIVVPLTTKIKKITQPTHYQFVNNKVKQVACCEQIRTVDKVRLGASLGFVRKEDVDAISRCVHIAVGEIEFVPKKKEKPQSKEQAQNKEKPQSKEKSQSKEKTQKKEMLPKEKNPKDSKTQNRKNQTPENHSAKRPSETSKNKKNNSQKNSKKAKNTKTES